MIYRRLCILLQNRMEMKRTLLLTILPAFILMFFAGSLAAQKDKSQRPSPPAQASGDIAGAMIKIDYSSPGVKGREVWGGLVPYNKVWRTGANEATVFETSKDITVNGSPLPAGRYSLYTMPGKDVWTVIFNSVPDQWGTKYDESKDVLRVYATPTQGEFLERMQFEVLDDQVILGWEKVRVPLMIKG